MDGDVRQLISRFLGAMRRRGSPRTAENYGWGLDNLATFLEGRGIVAMDQVREEDLEAWQDAIQARGWAVRSRSLAATAARSWLRWLELRDLAPQRLQRAVDSVKVPKGVARPIPAGDLNRILAYLGPRRRDATLRELRDRALFHYLLTTTARISEALQVRRDDYRSALVRQKGGDLKELLIPPTVRRMVDEYLHLRRDEEPWLWVSTEPGKPVRLLTRDGANRAWKAIAYRLQMVPWSSHRLRDTAATFLTRRGVPTVVVSDVLGHEDPGMVAKYVAIADESRQQVLDLMEDLVAATAGAPAPFRPGIVRVRGRADTRSRRGAGPRARVRRPNK